MGREVQLVVILCICLTTLSHKDKYTDLIGVKNLEYLESSTRRMSFCGYFLTALIILKQHFSGKCVHISYLYFNIITVISIT